MPDARRALLLVTLLSGLPLLMLITPGRPEVRAAEVPAVRPWTFQDAFARLTVTPSDGYLQYLSLQTAARERRFGQAVNEVETLITGRPAEARTPVSLLDPLGDPAEQLNAVQRQVFHEAYGTGAAAPPRRRRLLRRRPRDEPQPAPRAVPQAPPEIVAVATLPGPRLPVRDWKMVKPEVPAASLSRHVPADNWYVETKSLNKLLDLQRVLRPLAHNLPPLFDRSVRESTAGDRLKRQLLIEDNPVLQPLLDLVIVEAAFTGGEVPFRDGGDLSVILRVNQPALLRPRFDEAITGLAARLTPAPPKTEGVYHGVPFAHIGSPDRSVHVFWAWPRPDIVIRSNCQPALERLIDLALDAPKDPNPPPPPGSLAALPEFTATRGRLPRAADEDVFVYLSEPFLRRLLSPQARLTAARRTECAGQQRVIARAAAMFRGERGTWPASPQALVQAGTAPPLVGDGGLRCPDGGKYSLSADGQTAVCTHHGPELALRPADEVPLTDVTAEEAEEYAAFARSAEQSWGGVFGPLGAKVSVTPVQVRVEAVVPPLPDGLVARRLTNLGGAPESFDAPLLPGTVASASVRLDRDRLFRDATSTHLLVIRFFGNVLGIPIGLPPALQVPEFIRDGLGTQAGIHLVDAPPESAAPLLEYLGTVLGTDQQENRPLRQFSRALRAPVYVTLGLRDVAATEAFLRRLDDQLAGLAARLPGRGILFEQSFVRGTGPSPIRVYQLRVGPIQVQLCWLRVGKTLYIASRPAMLETLLTKKPSEPTAAIPGHAQIRFRHEGPNSVVELRRGWLDKSRLACRRNIATLDAVARSVPAPADEAGLAAAGELTEIGGHLSGEICVCPDGGRYRLQPDGTVICTVHGRGEQLPADAGASGVDQVLKKFAGATGTLIVEEAGLRVIGVLERRPNGM